MNLNETYIFLHFKFNMPMTYDKHFGSILDTTNTQATLISKIHIIHLTFLCRLATYKFTTKLLKKGCEGDG
jgi:hypothetical protein